MANGSKRILIVCKGHPNIAGAQLYLKHLSSIFSKTEDELHFALHKEDGLRFIHDIAAKRPVSIWEFDWRHLTFAKSLFAGLKLFKKINPDIIFFNSTEDEILPPVWAAWFCRIPIRLMAVHWAQSPDGMPLFRKRPGFLLAVPSRYAIKTRVVRGIAYHLLHKIVFVNQISRKAYIKLYKIASKRCITIYNGIEPEPFQTAKSERIKMRQNLGLKDQECMILAAGNLTEVKGYSFLISAVHALLQHDINVKCFIAGQGALREELEGQILSLHIENYVKLLGYRDDLPLLLSAADIFCMPSLNEALGYSLLEAMAAGVPVIASDVGGIPEVFTDGNEGLLVPPGNAQALSQAIEKLVRDNPLRIKMGAEGLKTVRDKFSLDQMLAQTASLFSKLSASG